MLLSRTTKLFLPSLLPSFLPSFLLSISPSFSFPENTQTRRRPNRGGRRREAKSALALDLFLSEVCKNSKRACCASLPSSLSSSSQSVRFSSPLIERRLPLSFLLHPGRLSKLMDAASWESRSQFTTKARGRRERGRDRDTGRKRGEREEESEGGSPEIPICAAPNETSAGERRMGY